MSNQWNTTTGQEYLYKSLEARRPVLITCACPQSVFDAICMLAVGEPRLTSQGIYCQQRFSQKIKNILEDCKLLTLD